VIGYVSAFTAYGLTALAAFVFCALIGRLWAILPPLLIWPVFLWVDDPGPETLFALAIILGGLVAAGGGALGLLVRAATRRAGAGVTSRNAARG
jgi:hypothetical protein